MQMHEVGEVIQVANSGPANIKLAEGWKLLAVVPGAGAGSGSIVIYVLGKPAKAADPLAELAGGLGSHVTG